MNSPSWSKNTVWRYIALQLAGIFLLGLILAAGQYMFGLSLVTIFIILVSWILKDIIMFFFVWRSYDTRNISKLIGETAVAREKLNPQGYVEINGELWLAVSDTNDAPITPGKTVRINAIKGLKLYVSGENDDTN